MLQISEPDVMHSLSRDNPWWDPGRDLSMLKYPHYRQYFEPFRERVMNWGLHRSVILMGPRRVGKTVMLRQLIGHAIDSGITPKAVFFASVDTPLYSGISLEKLVDLFEQITGIGPDERRIVIFDEIQYLKDWEVHLKVLTDRHPNTRFVVSGSAAAALNLKSQESGAGRFTDFFLPPLTFAEFLDFSGFYKNFSKKKDDVQAVCLIDQINQKLVDYINWGGFPEALFSAEVQKNFENFAGREIIDRILLRDLPSLYGIQDVQELHRFFTMLAYNSGQEVNIDELSKKLQISKPTIRRYLEYLEAAFLVFRITRVDETGKTFQRMNQFKIYLANPSMRAALFGAVEQDDPYIGSMIETVIAAQLYHLDKARYVHYARWRSGRKDIEVDLVIVDPKTFKPHEVIEVKWTDRSIDHTYEIEAAIQFTGNNMSDPKQLCITTKTINLYKSINNISVFYLRAAQVCESIGRGCLSRTLENLKDDAGVKKT